MNRNRLIGWVAIAAAAVAMLLVAGFDTGGVETDTERIQRLSNSYACPVCAGQSVAESDAEVAKTIRQNIRTEVQSGTTDEQIRDQLVGLYGGEVLLNPPAQGIATLVWVLPVVVVVLGAGGITAMLTGQKHVSVEATAEDIALVELTRFGDGESTSNSEEPSDSGDSESTVGDDT